jgi:hypothetical protein
MHLTFAELNRETAYVAVRVNNNGGQDLAHKPKLELRTVFGDYPNETKNNRNEKCNKGNLDIDKEVLTAQ